MDLSTRVYLKKKFKEYYFRNRVPAPSEVERREFGVGTLDDKIKSRHKAFEGGRELTQYLKREAPFYISYSSAYYEYPATQPMSDKGWLGADLVFDLDVDMEYFDQERLDHVREETVNLVGFLTADFGFAEKDIEVNFSGGKGYHLHIKREDVRQLSGNERREIVDYVTGTGLNLSCFLREEAAPGVIADKAGSYTKSAVVVKGPTGGEAGWGGRIYETVHGFLESSSQKDYMKIRGVGLKTAEKLIADREKNLKALERGSWDGLVDVTEGLLGRVISDASVELLGDTDKMVTIDTARLMRLPDTIHGGSGLLAARVDKLGEYDPLVSAVAFNGPDLKIKIIKDVPKFDLMEQKWGKYKAESVEEVPEYVGMYLMLKGAAQEAT